MKLRELDERIIPDVARRTQTAAARVRQVRRRTSTRLARARPSGRRAAGPTRPASAIVRLRALDARLSNRGPLALLRDLPQLGALVIAVLVLISGATVAQRSEPRQDLVASEPDGSAPDGSTPGAANPSSDGGLLGPEIGDNVGEYLDRADRRLQDRIVANPDERSFAVVSFARYLTPAEAAAVLGDDVGGFRVFFRVPAAGVQTEVEDSAVRRLVPDSLAAFARVATQRRADIGPLLEMARTTEDPAFKSFFEMTAKAYQIEIDKLSAGCACVFGVVTNAANADLRELRAKPAVRVVDIGPQGAGLDVLTFRALLPEEKVTVTGGNEAPSDAGLTGG
ncbi:MAG TPA: hypothetical protein VNA30_03520 [Mycobacteriales bacterium]|nr:hypothetical protein [Mycobacteriales bacterium]